MKVEFHYDLQRLMKALDGEIRNLNVEHRLYFIVVLTGQGSREGTNTMNTKANQRGIVWRFS